MNDKYLADGEPERRPFDLEAAMRGEPLVTRNGLSVKFVAYVPEATEYPVIAFIEGENAPDRFTDEGRYSARSQYRIGYEHSPRDLFMTPKPKRTVWVNFHEKNNMAIWYTSEDLAKFSADSQTVAVAVPVQIDVW